MKNANNQSKNTSFLLEKSREPLLNVPFIIVVLIALCSSIYFIPQYFFSHKLYTASLEFFSFIPGAFKAKPLEFCHTIVSYSFMHSSLKHLALNMVWLLIFGSILARHLGDLRFIIFWILTAIIAVLTYFIFHQESVVPLVGASGAISGMMGAVIRYIFSLRDLGATIQNKKFLGPLLPLKKALYSKEVLISIGVWLSIDFMIGLSSFFFEGESVSIAWEAHIGGFISGFFLIGFFDFSQKKCKTTI
ncbi:rhomboid family intramembrane serine protease [Bartonella rattaustraliani]|uniref:rhomboid family intramembrane serine protease n=1 Tax=Bartonella rattaustraliani TaxID=481139 RepID=UPI000315BFAE|nr:rhomboid family intramembrane serine protease [Bartonella rattaustraliani]